MATTTDDRQGLFEAAAEAAIDPRTLAGWTAGIAGFGCALGTYGGVGGALLATWKVPLVVLLAVLVTLPSLAVFTALTSGSFSWTRTLRLAARTAATLGALLLALAPVMWLFASSSWFLGWPVLVATALGAAALLVAGGRIASVQGKARVGYLLWLLLLIPVTLQVVTTLRPVVTPLAPRGPERMFFLQHFGEIVDFRLPGSSQPD